MNDNYLSPEEKSLVIAFNSGPKMVGAVKKVLLHTIYKQGVLKPGEPAERSNWVFGILNSDERTDEEVARKLTASLKGLAYLESGFEQLKDFVVHAPIQPKEIKSV